MGDVRGEGSGRAVRFAGRERFAMREAEDLRRAAEPNYGRNSESRAQRLPAKRPRELEGRPQRPETVSERILSRGRGDERTLPPKRPRELERRAPGLEAAPERAMPRGGGGALLDTARESMRFASRDREELERSAVRAAQAQQAVRVQRDHIGSARRGREELERAAVRAAQARQAAEVRRQREAEVQREARAAREAEARREAQVLERWRRRWSDARPERARGERVGAEARRVMDAGDADARREAQVLERWRRRWSDGEENLVSEGSGFEGERCRRERPEANLRRGFAARKAMKGGERWVNPGVERLPLKRRDSDRAFVVERSLSGRRVVEQNLSERRIVEQSFSERRTVEQRSLEGRIVEQTLSERRLVERSTADRDGVNKFGRDAVFASGVVERAVEANDMPRREDVRINSRPAKRPRVQPSAFESRSFPLRDESVLSPRFQDRRPRHCSPSFYPRTGFASASRGSDKGLGVEDASLGMASPPLFRSDGRSVGLSANRPEQAHASLTSLGRDDGEPVDSSATSLFTHDRDDANAAVASKWRIDGGRGEASGSEGVSPSMDSALGSSRRVCISGGGRKASGRLTDECDVNMRMEHISDDLRCVVCDTKPMNSEKSLSHHLRSRKHLTKCGEIDVVGSEPTNITEKLAVRAQHTRRVDSPSLAADASPDARLGRVEEEDFSRRESAGNERIADSASSLQHMDSSRSRCELSKGKLLLNMEQALSQVSSSAHLTKAKKYHLARTRNAALEWRIRLDNPHALRFLQRSRDDFLVSCKNDFLMCTICPAVYGLRRPIRSSMKESHAVGQKHLAAVVQAVKKLEGAVSEDDWTVLASLNRSASELERAANGMTFLKAAVFSAPQDPVSILLDVPLVSEAVSTAFFSTWKQDSSADLAERDVEDLSCAADVSIATKKCLWLNLRMSLEDWAHIDADKRCVLCNTTPLDIHALTSHCLSEEHVRNCTLRLYGMAKGALLARLDRYDNEHAVELAQRLRDNFTVPHGDALVLCTLCDTAGMRRPMLSARMSCHRHSKRHVAAVAKLFRNVPVEILTGNWNAFVKLNEAAKGMPTGSVHRYPDDSVTVDNACNSAARSDTKQTSTGTSLKAAIAPVPEVARLASHPSTVSKHQPVCLSLAHAPGSFDVTGIESLSQEDDAWLDAPMTWEDWKSLETQALDSGGNLALAFKTVRDTVLSPVGAGEQDLSLYSSGLRRVPVGNAKSTRELVIHSGDVALRDGVTKDELDAVVRVTDKLASSIDPFIASRDSVEAGEIGLGSCGRLHGHDGAVSLGVEKDGSPNCTISGGGLSAASLHSKSTLLDPLWLSLIPPTLENAIERSAALL